MTNAIDQYGNTVSSHSLNLVPENEMRASSRDETAEREQKGYYKKHLNWISDKKMEANLNAVIRGWSRIHIDGIHQLGDLILIEGMELEFSAAFFVDRAEHGSPDEKKLVRQIWIVTALGKMTSGELQGCPDKGYQPYE